MKLISTKLLTTTLLASFVAGAAYAAPVIYDDVLVWEAAMSSNTPVVLPPTNSTNMFSAGDLTFTKSGGASNLIVGHFLDWSTLIAGDDLAISGPEDVTVDFGTAVTGFSFLMHEPTRNAGLASDSCNAACVDSTFNFKLFDGVTEIASFLLNPIDNVANFVGFSSMVAFDRLVIDDVTGTIDNEFFGEFRTGTIAVVPLPAGLPLLLAGLGGLMALKRRRRT